MQQTYTIQNELVYARQPHRNIFSPIYRTFFLYINQHYLMSKPFRLFLRQHQMSNNYIEPKSFKPNWLSQNQKILKFGPLKHVHLFVGQILPSYLPGTSRAEELLYTAGLGFIDVDSHTLATMAFKLETTQLEEVELLEWNRLKQ